jgi:hypothetical protein
MMGERNREGELFEYPMPTPNPTLAYGMLVTKYMALPSPVAPSDHLPIIVDVQM